MRQKRRAHSSAGEAHASDEEVGRGVPRQGPRLAEEPEQLLRRRVRGKQPAPAAYSASASRSTF
eukprot:11588836-Alexandrium_andersonii.AAC.1